MRGYTVTSFEYYTKSTEYIHYIEEKNQSKNSKDKDKEKK